MENLFESEGKYESGEIADAMDVYLDLEAPETKNK